MAKGRRTITTLLPGHERNRYRWRRRILANVLQAASKAGVKYNLEDRFEVVVLLYLTKGKRHDIYAIDIENDRTGPLAPV
jgi:transposase